ncbi:MAG: hypothetical protein AAF962_02095 [Actinomycetota bacterium]
MTHTRYDLAREIKQSLERQFPGFEVSVVDDAKTSGSFVGIVGVRGPGEIGSGGVAASAPVLCALVTDVPETELNMLDWAGELANHMLGRVKLALGPRARSLRASSPVVLPHASMAFTSTDTLYLFELRNGDHHFIAWFDLDLGDADPNTCAEEDPDGLPGQIILFD